jgi:hypothetical protein
MFYIDRTTKQYPLNRWEAMSRNPDISGAINWDDATLAALNVWPVWARATAVQPNYDQKCIESDPIEIDGSWYQSWIAVSLSQEELDTKLAEQWQAVIQTQQAILATNVEILPSGNVILASAADLDHAELISTAMSSGNVEITADAEIEIPESDYQTYLAAVSAVTSQSNPFEIIWPTNPFGTDSIALRG